VTQIAFEMWDKSQVTRKSNREQKRASPTASKAHPPGRPVPIQEAIFGMVTESCHITLPNLLDWK
jgi:hypothetical protein